MTSGVVRRLAEAAFAVLLVLYVSVPLWGQTSGSTILGQVKDASGAVISGAKVEVLATNTGQKRETQTGSDGTFTVPNLPAGPYRVTVTQSGFGGQAKELTLLVGQSADLIFTLSPAAREEEVKVEAETPLIETSSATIHKNITPEQVQTLPINGRDFSSLAILVPGVTAGNTSISANYDPVKRNVPAISINGQNGRNLFMAIDGGDNTDIFMGGQNLTLSLEAVQEFEVITHDPKAQYGRGIGGVINVVTKSGSNEFHGSGFGFFRDDSLQSNDAISEMFGNPKPPFDSRQFGGTIGGPIKKDRAFFFYSYERQQNDTSRTFNSGGAFPSTPTFNGDGTVTPQAFRQNFHLARVDVKVADNHSLFGRYAEQDNDSTNEFFSDQDAPDSTADESNRFHDVVIGLSSLIGNNKVNDLRFHYQWWQNSIQNTVSSNDVPTIILPAATFGASQAGTQAPKEISYQFSDDFSWTHGRHNIRFGGNVIVQPHIGIDGDFRHNRYIFANNDYDPTMNTIGPTNQAVNFRSWSSPGFDIVNRTLTHVGFYIQDDIRFGRVIVTAGLRYDYTHNLFYNRGTTFEQIVRDNVGMVPGGPSRSTPTDDKNNFAPRLGIAYDVRGNGQFVVRAGYARIFDPASILASTLFADLEIPQVNGNPPFDFVFVPNLPMFNLFPAFGIPCQTTPCVPTIVDTTAAPTTFPIGFVNSPDMEVARADQFNVGFAYQIQSGALRGLTFDVDGVYSRTRKLIQGRNLNFCLNADPTCGSGVNFPAAGADPLFGIPRQVYLDDTTGRNDYTALIVSVRKALAKRWELFSSYTLSRAITDTNQFTFVVLDQLNPNGPGDLGPTNWDERHRVVISALVELPWKIRFSNIFTGASARPYSATGDVERDANGDPVIVIDPVTMLPSTVPICDLNGDGVPTVFGAIDNGPGGSRTHNISSCDLNTSARYGGGRGGLRGDPTFSWDIRVAKIFSLEGLSPQAQIEALFEVFNLTDAANFGQNFFDDATDLDRFGTPINIISPPRTVQLGVKFRF